MHVSPKSGILAGRWFGVAIAIATMGVSLAACSGEETTGGGRSGETPPGMGERVASEPAIKAITEARCDFEQRCGNVGQDRTYADTDHCQARFKTDYGKELNSWECPGGIGRSELDKCLTEIRNSDCKSPIDLLERAITCRSGALCKPAPQ